MLGVPAWLALQHYSAAYLLADIRVAGGEWRSRTLADGSRITLNGGSAVNVRFDGARRVMELVQGEVLVDVARDPHRPFDVETAQGSMRALGTRFVVTRDGDATVLSMLESRVAVRAVQKTRTARAAETDHAGAAGQARSALPGTRAGQTLAGAAPAVVVAGERVRIDAAGVGPVENVDPAAISDAWRLHQLVVDNQPLSNVLDQLDRQRPGRIVFNRAALAGIRVSAVLPLDDTDRALDLLLTNFPQLRIRTVSPYLVLVDLPQK